MRNAAVASVILCCWLASFGRAALLLRSHARPCARQPPRARGRLNMFLGQKQATDRFAAGAGVNEFRERLESGKAAVAGAVAGGVAFAPVDLVLHLGDLPQWEFNTDQFSFCSALFAVVYRYAVREDRNPQLKQGVLGAFVLTRALGSVHVSSSCSWLPLSCGAPLGYLDWRMLGEASSGVIEAGVGFGTVAFVLEALMSKGLLKPFPSIVSSNEGDR